MYFWLNTVPYAPCLCHTNRVKRCVPGFTVVIFRPSTKALDGEFEKPAAGGQVDEHVAHVVGEADLLDDDSHGHEGEVGTPCGLQKKWSQFVTTLG